MLCSMPHWKRKYIFEYITSCLCRWDVELFDLVRFDSSRKICSIANLAEISNSSLQTIYARLTRPTSSPARSDVAMLSQCSRAHRVSCKSRRPSRRFVSGTDTLAHCLQTGFALLEEKNSKNLSVLLWARPRADDDRNLYVALHFPCETFIASECESEVEDR